MASNNGGVGLQIEAFTDLLPGAQDAETVVMLDPKVLQDSDIRERAPFDPEQREDDRLLVENVRGRYESGERGIIQPLLVLSLPNGGYKLIAGHRRKYAALHAEVPKVPCLVRYADSEEAAAEQAIENLLRRDLTPLEEGRLYMEIQELTGWSGREIARNVGSAPRTVHERMRLPTLPTPVQRLLQQDALGIKHAIACDDEAFGGRVGELASKHGLTVPEIKQVMEQLHSDGDSAPDDIVDELVKAKGTEGDPPATRQRSSPSEKRHVERPRLDYAAVVNALGFPIAAERSELLGVFAEEASLSEVEVRWAGLLLAGDEQLMTPAAAAAYASQLGNTNIGSALRALHLALERLERRTTSSAKGSMTPNLVTGATAAIGDLLERLGAVSGQLEQTLGLSCAAAGKQVAADRLREEE